MGWSAEWMVVPRSTVRAARVAIGSGLFYLAVAYVHFWSRPSDSATWPSLLLAGGALVSIWCGYSLLRVMPSSWGVSHGFFVVMGLANLALVPLMFDLPFVMSLLGGALTVVVLVSLQTEDAFAIAEPEVQAQRPEPVIFKMRSETDARRFRPSAKREGIRR
jgi:hypothetical protein